MRIWLGPWEDADGDLHADGYIYSEVEGRKWNLGERVKIPWSHGPAFLRQFPPIVNQFNFSAACQPPSIKNTSIATRFQSW